MSLLMICSRYRVTYPATSQNLSGTPHTAPETIRDLQSGSGDLSWECGQPTDSNSAFRQAL